jgi:hypothetical protein
MGLSIRARRQRAADSIHWQFGAKRLTTSGFSRQNMRKMIRRPTHPGNILKEDYL